MFIQNLNPHASQSPGCPTRMADTFLCGWAHTQTKLLRSAMWRIPITEVKHNSETAPSYESRSAAQFSREASDPVTSSYNRFNRETGDRRVEDREFCRRKKKKQKGAIKQTERESGQITTSYYTYCFRKCRLRFLYGRFSWPGHQIIIFLFMAVHFWLHRL